MFKAPKGEADTTSRCQSAEKQLGWSEGVCANLRGEGETQPTASKAGKYENKLCILPSGWWAGLLHVHVTSVTLHHSLILSVCDCCVSINRNPPPRKSWSPLCSAQDSNAAVNLTYIREIRENTFAGKKIGAESPLIFLLFLNQRQSSSGTQLGDRRRKTGQRRSDGASAGSEERVSTSTTIPPAYQKRHFQTVDLNLDYMSVKGHIKPGNASVLRRKWNTSLYIHLNKYITSFKLTCQLNATNKHRKQHFNLRQIF